MDLYKLRALDAKMLVYASKANNLQGLINVRINKDRGNITQKNLVTMTYYISNLLPITNLCSVIYEFRVSSNLSDYNKIINIFVILLLFIILLYLFYYYLLFYYYFIIRKDYPFSMWLKHVLMVEFNPRHLTQRGIVSSLHQ